MGLESLKKFSLSLGLRGFNPSLKQKKQDSSPWRNLVAVSQV